MGTGWGAERKDVSFWDGLHENSFQFENKGLGKLLSTFAAAIVYSGLNRAFLFSHRLFCYFDAFGHFFCSAQELTQAENLVQTSRDHSFPSRQMSHHRKSPQINCQATFITFRLSEFLYPAFRAQCFLSTSLHEIFGSQQSPSSVDWQVP